MTVVDPWLRALERRHLSDLTFSEVVRALRALSSCYVERRGKLASGAALDSRGKRAAFALFYGPVHFLAVGEILHALPDDVRRVRHVVDLGCGTGAAGAAWALESGAIRVDGTDRNAWTAGEANWTYRELRLRGRAVQGRIEDAPLRAREGTGIMAAYVVNELTDAARGVLLDRLLTAAAANARVLIIEPIARRMLPWWPVWRGAFEAAGGRADEWRFDAPLPERQRDLARAAGLDPRTLAARSLLL